MKNYMAVDLFAGIGGVKLGLEQAGFTVVYSNDCDIYCKITFEQNFNNHLDTRKIEDVQLSELPDNIDLLTAGFPCQPFSQAGYQKGLNDPRGQLFNSVAKIIKTKKPRAFLLENVKNLKIHDKGKTYAYIIDTLRNELGYYVPEPHVLNSKFFGVPQHRERIYIVGFREKTDFYFPTGNKRIPRLGRILENRITDETYFLTQKYYDSLLLHKKRHQEKGHGFGLHILNKKGISNTLVVGDMGRERNLIRDLQSDMAFSKNNKGVRRLTIRECARLQGFPETFTFPVSKTQAYKQLGNTVSVPVIKAIAVNIKKSLQETHKREHLQFSNASKLQNIDLINI